MASKDILEEYKETNYVEDNHQLISSSLQTGDFDNTKYIGGNPEKKSYMITLFVIISCYVIIIISIWTFYGECSAIPIISSVLVSVLSFIMTYLSIKLG